MPMLLQQQIFKHREYLKVMLQNIPKEKILDIVKLGPTLPTKVAKALGGGGDTMLIGAILSTLISSGDVKVSILKVGGSPLYYVPEQESKLEDFINYLNEKDKKTFRFLKENKVLQDSAQDSLTRVSLRTIKDFAKQFEVDYKSQKVLCWRFYAVPLEEAQTIAKQIITIAKPIEVEEPAVEVEQQHEHKVSLIIEPKPIVEHHEEKHAEIVQQVLEEKAREQANDSLHSEMIHEKHEHHDKAQSEKHTETKIHIPKVSKVKEPKQPKASKTSKAEYNFYELILNHVASKKLDVISKEKIKKTEYDLVLKNHETNEYIYCKAKDKPTLSEGDLAPAIIFAQNKKMPCLFLSTGVLNKKAELMLGKDFVGLTFEKILVNQ